SQRILAGEGEIYVAGGVESISLVQNEMNKHHFQDEWLHRHQPESYWPLRKTAEYVARRYGIPREEQDRFGVQSQQRAAKARAAGKFKDEIAPITTKMKLVDKNTGAETMREVTAAEDEGIRPDTTYEGVSQIKPAIEGGCIAAGNASQFSDGAAAAVVMSGREAAKRGLQPLGIFRGFAVAGCDPKEMGIGPVFAVPKLLEQTGKRVGDIDLWELNEAFAVQVLYCRDRIGIPDERLNVNGGAIALGHPSGMTAAQRQRPDRVGFRDVGAGALGLRVENDRAGARLAAEPRREVRHVADRRVFPALLEADHPEGRLALRDADAQADVVAQLLPGA